MIFLPASGKIRFPNYEDELWDEFFARKFLGKKFAKNFSKADPCWCGWG